MTISYSGLNPRQREAVLHGDGPLLILAGAGTGKTRTLAYRIAHLVERGVPAAEILAVSFTNKAADELRHRVQGLLGKQRAAPAVSTFHSFCCRVLRREIERLGYKRNFTIYDAPDQMAVVKEAVKELKLPGGDLDVKRLAALISRAKNDGGRPDPGDGTDPYAIFAHELFPRYSDALRAYNALDFDDLLLLTLRLFEEHPEVVESWRATCRHILVDEFQDTNAVQYRLVSLLAQPDGWITVVGDDDQSIYGWRGALPGNIHAFATHWPGTKTVVLEQNYRSTNRILSAANAVINRNPAARRKKLWSQLGDGVPVGLLTCRDGEDEGSAAAEWFARKIVAGDARPGDCAIIYRTNAQSRPFEDALRRARLRYTVVGGICFYDRKEVRDLISYLSAIHNRRDEIALLRVINYPHRGIGRETVHRLQEESLRSKRPLHEILADAASVAGVGERPAQAVGAFVELLDRHRAAYRPGHVAQATLELVRDIGLERAAFDSVKDVEAGERKVENIREVIAAMKVWEAENPTAGIEGWLAGVSLNSRDDDEDGFSENAVTLLTVHAAKGLEYPHVFLAGLEEGILPHRRSEGESGGMQEERRLIYVGMTRARKSLVLSHAVQRLRRDKMYPALPSRFLDELEETGIEFDRVNRLRVTAVGPADAVEEASEAEAFFKWTKEKL